MNKATLFMIWAVALAFFSIPCSDAAEELVIVGTGSGVPVLGAIGKAFSERQSDVRIIVPESIGSGGGIKAVGNDEFILGRVARDIKDNEKRYGLVQTPIARLPIVFYVNDSVTLTGITAKDADRIFDGTIRRWEDIGGGKGKIRVIKREEGDSSLVVLRNTLPGFGDITMTPRSKTTYTDQQTVEACKLQENSITFGSLPDIRNQKGIHALELDGVSPTDPAYPHVGILSLVYKEKNYSGNVEKLITFIASDAAKTAIIASGGLPIQ
jgi:phosphate transport system substrate-binding protein